MRKIEENKREMNENLEVRGVEWYKAKIVEMVGQMEDKKFLKMIYGYVGSAYREEKSRG